MKNKILIIIAASFSFLMSKTIELEMAQRVAGNIYAERSKTGSLEDFNVRSVEKLTDDSEILMYLFHLEPTGFIIVPSDDRVTPMLAYGFEHPFVTDNMNSNTAWMLDAYKNMIKKTIDMGESATERINTQWQKYMTGNGLNIRNRDMKGPLLISHWNQSGTWNDYCPGETSCDGDQVPSGCVAVSMSAIMHYWKYPTIGSGDNSCYCGGWGTQYANFGDAFYDYAAMGDAESGSEAASYLVWHAAVAVNMDYDCEGSGAQVTGGYPSALYALENNFLYKDNIYTSYRSSASDSQWINYLVEEIDNNRPMIYVGYNDEGGHAWNCDGYDDEMFHMNWGWGGQSDGWFTVTENGDPDGWGDGSHILRNIQPESLNRPNLRLTTFNTSETSGDGDSVINPGETFEIVIELENPAPWAAASNIELLLTTEESGVTIDDNTSSIISNEPLEPGDLFTNESMPFIVSLDDEVHIGKKTFKLMVLGVGIPGAEDNFYYKEYDLEILVSLNQYGFPVYEASQKTSPLMVDMDGDGSDEIVYGDYNGFIHVLNSDGSMFNDNFPFDTGNQVWGSPAAADMDGDGLMDVAVLSKSKHFYLLDMNGVKVDFDSEKFLLGTPAIGNLDDDMDLEVVFSGYSSGNLVWALNADGTSVEGFPIELGEKVKVGVALADFNGNGKDDIVVGTDSDKIHLFYDDGTEAPGFPFEVGDKVQSAPSVLDVNGQKVIFAGSNNAYFYAINADGSLRFSIETTDDVFNSPAFLEHAGSQYVLFSDDEGVLHVVDMDGNAMEGWPVDVNVTISKSIILSDLDGDGSPEIIAVTEFSDVLAFNLDGSIHGDFPISADAPFFSAPLTADLDGDGDLEIVAGSGGSLQAIDVKSSGSYSGYWNMFRGNSHRTGYGVMEGESECGASIGDVTGDGIVNILDIVQVANYVLGASTPEYECAADFNGDGTVNILDLVQIANFILND